MDKEREAFSRWVLTHPDNLDITSYEENIMFDAWQAAKAGAASRQAEINELQNRIDEAMKYVSESPLKDVSRRAMLNFLDILKGKQND